MEEGAAARAGPSGQEQPDRCGKQEVSSHRQLQLEQTPGAKAAPVPGRCWALGHSVRPTPPASPQTRAVSSSLSPSPVPQSKAPEGKHSSPPSHILLCLKPHQVLGPEHQCPRRPRAAANSRTSPTALFISPQIPESKWQGRTWPNTPRGPNSPCAKYEVTKKSSNVERYKRAMYFLNCGSGCWILAALRSSFCR